jgi:membrane-associated phospholipid phosphatase
VDAHPLVEAVRRAWHHLGLNLSSFVIVVGAVTALVGSVAVFGAATEDVTQRNGLEIRDAARLKLFTAHRSAFDVHAARLATTVGAVPILVVLAAAVGVVFWRRRLSLAVAVSPVVALALAGLAVGVVKSVVGRPRPPVALHLVSESDASFPSGHATDSTAVFLTIAFVCAVFVFRRPILRVASVVAAGALSVAVGASRLVLGVHWPSDVLAGLALGLGVALTVTITSAAISRLAVPPPANPGTVRGVAARLQRRLAAQRRVEPPGLQAA